MSAAGLVVDLFAVGNSVCPEVAEAVVRANVLTPAEAAA